MKPEWLTSIKLEEIDMFLNTSDVMTNNFINIYLFLFFLLILYISITITNYLSTLHVLSHILYILFKWTVWRMERIKISALNGKFR